MASIRRTRIAVVAAVLTAAAALTACQSDDSDAKSAGASNATAAPATAAPGQPAPAAADTTAAATGRPASDPSNPSAPAKGETAKTGTTASTGGNGNGSGSGNGSGTGSTIDDLNQGKGVNGTWFGTVKYLAPGKYTVSDIKGVEQQFFLAQDTEIWGAGEFCGDAEGQSATKCTEAELEATTKGDGVSAEVVIANGIATKITEDH